MAGETQIPEQERREIQEALQALKAKHGSWQKVCDALNAGVEEDSRVEQETIRKAGVNGVLGAKVVRIVKRSLGTEAPTPQRYPTRAPAAAIMRGLVSDEAIEAMLTEEHWGTISDPGIDFWVERARFWEARRREIQLQFGPVQTPELDSPPPMEPRPRKRR